MSVRNKEVMAGVGTAGVEGVRSEFRREENGLEEEKGWKEERGKREEKERREEQVPREAQGSRRGRLTERDRELMGHLGLTRYLRTDQVSRLVFAGRSQPVVSTRLGELSTRGAGRRPWLRRLAYVIREARRVLVWALTTEGYEVAESVLGRQMRIQRHDVAPQFLEHATGMNELYVGLAEKRDGKSGSWQAMRGKPATDFARVPAAAAWRWVPTEDLELSFQDFDRQSLASIDKRLQPDAVIESARLRRRWLIEYETGTASVRNTEHRAATLTKLQRYDTFLTAVVDGDPQRSHYRLHYRDAAEPELLFVTLGEPRQATITQAIAEYFRSTSPRRMMFRARAVTLDQAKREFRQWLLGEVLAPKPQTAVPPAPAQLTLAAPAITISPKEMQIVLGYATALHASLSSVGAVPPQLVGETRSILQATATLYDAFKTLRAIAREANRPVPAYVDERARYFVLSLLDRLGVRKAAR